MSTKEKSSVKKNVMTGAGLAAGVAAGVGASAVIFPQEAAAESIEPVKPGPIHRPGSEPSKHHEQHHPTTNDKPTDEHIEPTSEQDPIEPEPTEPDPIVVEPEPIDGEIEVISYERVSTDDGNEIDVAFVRVDGEEMVFADLDLDGAADVMAFDENGEGEVGDNEYFNVCGMGVSMAPFQENSGFDPLLTSNNEPDYTNDADVSSYMA